jgi:hypothetical protein
MVQGQERRSDRTARMKQAELQYPPHHHERQPRPLSYGRQQLYGPGIPGPEMEHQLATTSLARQTVKTSPQTPQVPATSASQSHGATCSSRLPTKQRSNSPPRPPSQPRACSRFVPSSHACTSPCPHPCAIHCVRRSPPSWRCAPRAASRMRTPPPPELLMLAAN